MFEQTLADYGIFCLGSAWCYISSIETCNLKIAYNSTNTMYLLIYLPVYCLVPISSTYCWPAIKVGNAMFEQTLITVLMLVLKQ